MSDAFTAVDEIVETYDMLRVLFASPDVMADQECLERIGKLLVQMQAVLERVVAAAGARA